MELTEAIRTQAVACGRLGSPMYADLLTVLADDAAAGGATARVLAGLEDAPGPSAVALRLMGSLHRLVLEGRAPQVAGYVPSVGGTWHPERGPAAVLAFLAEQPDAVREWLDRPPQTNEVGRSAALMAGLLELTAAAPLPVRLVELGSSAGLNLLADRFRYVHADGRAVGPADSPTVLDGAWTGPVALDAPWPRIVERRGCDVAPLDATTAEGRTALMAYCWPDMAARLDRLRGAVELARRDPPRVDTMTALELVEALEPADGRWTVVWHSVMWQYLDRAEKDAVRARLDALGASAAPERPFAHLFLEPTAVAGGRREFLLTLETWPDGRRRVLAAASPHGLPTAVRG
jgi:hypothetical protein